jgi:hypothetical protein
LHHTYKREKFPFPSPSAAAAHTTVCYRLSN